MLLRCCLIHRAIIILRHILYLVYPCSCLGLGLFMSYLCDLRFIFSLTFIVINHITLFKRPLGIFWNISNYFWMIRWMKKANNFPIVKASGCCLVFSFFNLNFAMLIKRLVIKRSVYFIV